MSEVVHVVMALTSIVLMLVGTAIVLVFGVAIVKAAIVAMRGGRDER